MQYENLLNSIWEMKEREPRFIPISPVVLESSSGLLLNPESMHPKMVPEKFDPAMIKLSIDKVPSEDDASAYDRMAWHRFLESHEAGMEKS